MCVCANLNEQKRTLYLTLVVFRLSSPDDLTARSCQMSCLKSCCRKLASSPLSGATFGTLLCVCLQRCVWSVLLRPRCVTQLGVAVVRLVFKAPQPEGWVTHTSTNTQKPVFRDHVLKGYSCPNMGLTLSVQQSDHTDH